MSESPQPYRVLARKYRPQSFQELIGQEAMVRTLANAISRDRLIRTGVDVQQMELLGHDFFMFFNADTGSVNVLYKRQNGGYGVLIEYPRTHALVEGVVQWNIVVARVCPGIMLEHYKISNGSLGVFHCTSLGRHDRSIHPAGDRRRRARRRARGRAGSRTRGAPPDAGGPRPPTARAAPAARARSPG